MLPQLLTTAPFIAGLAASTIIPVAPSSRAAAALPTIDCTQFFDSVYEWWTLWGFNYNSATSKVDIDLQVYGIPGDYRTKCTATVTPGQFTFHSCDNPAIPTMFAVEMGSNSARIAFHQEFICQAHNGQPAATTVAAGEYQLGLCGNGNGLVLCERLHAFPVELQTISP